MRRTDKMSVDEGQGLSGVRGHAGQASKAKSAAGGEQIEWVEQPTVLGPMLIGVSEKGLCRLSFGEAPQAMARLFPGAELLPGGADAQQLAQELARKVAEPEYAVEVVLDLRGTPFQQSVWQELCRIPLGETRNYTQIADAVGRPTASRAVGNAVGSNPVSLLVPCHRVLRRDGGLGGYAWGMGIKRGLLMREGVLREMI